MSRAGGADPGTSQTQSRLDLAESLGHFNSCPLFTYRVSVTFWKEEGQTPLLPFPPSGPGASANSAALAGLSAGGRGWLPGITAQQGQQSTFGPTWVFPGVAQDSGLCGRESPPLPSPALAPDPVPSPAFRMKLHPSFWKSGFTPQHEPHPRASPGAAVGGRVSAFTGLGTDAFSCSVPLGWAAGQSG